MLASITPLILAYNESANLARTLEKLAWAKRIVLVDSFSSDETLALAAKHSPVEIFQRSFDDHSSQWNFGLGQVKTEWVLALDADYVLTDSLITELAQLKPPPSVNACFASFKFCVHGAPLRATLYPPRAVLFRPAFCRYFQDGHTQSLSIKGETARLLNAILHDDRKPLAHWLWAQARYADLEVQKLRATSVSALGFNDKVRRLILPAPVLVLLYTLFAKGLILDGWPGLYYVFQRTVAECILSLRLLEAKLAVAAPASPRDQ